MACTSPGNGQRIPWWDSLWSPLQVLELAVYRTQALQVGILQPQDGRRTDEARAGQAEECEFQALVEEGSLDPGTDDADGRVEQHAHQPEGQAVCSLGRLASCWVEAVSQTN